MPFPVKKVYNQTEDTGLPHRCERDVTAPEKLHRNRNVQPSLRARYSLSVSLWTENKTFKSVFIHFTIAPNLIKSDFVYLSYERYGNLTSVGAGGEQRRSFLNKACEITHSCLPRPPSFVCPAKQRCGHPHVNLNLKVFIQGG